VVRVCVHITESLSLSRSLALSLQSAVMHQRALIVAALVAALVVAAAADAAPVPPADAAFFAFLPPAPPLAARPPARRAGAVHETQHCETHHYTKHPLWPAASVLAPAGGGHGRVVMAATVVEIQKSVLFIL